jgi:hypothetical protein
MQPPRRPSWTTRSRLDAMPQVNVGRLVCPVRSDSADVGPGGGRRGRRLGFVGLRSRFCRLPHRVYDGHTPCHPPTRSSVHGPPTMHLESSKMQDRLVDDCERLALLVSNVKDLCATNASPGTPGGALGPGPGATGSSRQSPRENGQQCGRRPIRQDST